HSDGAVAVLCSTLDEVREVAARATELAPSVRAVLAPFIPSGAVGLFSGLGIAAIRLDAAGLKGVKGSARFSSPSPPSGTRRSRPSWPWDRRRSRSRGSH